MVRVPRVSTRPGPVQSRLLNESKRPLLIPAGKLPLLPLVDRPHNARDLGPTEQGKAVQLKCLVLYVHNGRQLGL